MAATAKTFISFAAGIFKTFETNACSHSSTLVQKYRSFFGVTPYVAVLIWKKLFPSSPSGFEPKHLWWGLLFLKSYHMEHVNASMMSSEQKTFRKWSWTAVRMLANMKVIRWEERLTESTVNRAYVSVDGTIFRILEPKPFSFKWYSFKSHGPGLRYEVCIAISSGTIVWIHGPFLCGEFNDLRIYTELLKLEMLINAL